MLKTYAMTINDRVIDVLPDCESKPEWPPDDSGNQVIAIECDDTVERGMIYNRDNSKFECITVVEMPEESLPTQLDNIETTQLTIMTAMAEQYEESLERELTNMEVQATIYEAILELGGAE